METRLNPVQKNIAAGMSPLVAFLTESTCGEVCWEAREDICRCSCNGKNHGCMRTEDGSRPQRTAKIDGHRYVLKAADVQGIYAQAQAINKGVGYKRVDVVRAAKFDEAGNEIEKEFAYHYWWHETDRGAPARMKCATKDQYAKWPELAAWREKRTRPNLLWVREDINQKMEAEEKAVAA